MTSTNFTNNRVARKIYGIVGAVLTLAIPYFIMLNDGDKIESKQSLCPFKMLTGFPCPGCGMTKSLVFLYEGDWLKSLQYHVFGILIFLFCIATMIVLLLEIFTRKEYFHKILYSQKLAYILGIILGVYHLARLVVFVFTNSMGDIIRQSVWK